MCRGIGDVDMRQVFCPVYYTWCCYVLSVLSGILYVVLLCSQCSVRYTIRHLSLSTLYSLFLLALACAATLLPSATLCNPRLFVALTDILSWRLTSPW